ncbi:MAG: HlyD family efflux transporter periplasmic adaptor subunit [Gemmatimonadetes bacterium]|nr:HlyD family efflux transporter periplasmic adaptor subunit [Gemmatimonadota bacterium]
MIVPAERVEDTVECLLARDGIPGGAVYVSLLVVLLAGLVSLPLVRVPVSVRGTGLVRPVAERQEVRAGLGGVVEAVHTREHTTVRAGEVMVTLRSEAAQERRAALRGRIAELRAAISDLEVLTASDTGGGAVAARLRSRAYRRAYAESQAALRAESSTVFQATVEAERASRLAAAELAPVAELQARRSALAEASARRALVGARYRAEWSTQLAAARAELADRLAELAAADQDAELHRVRAPADGTVEEMAALAAGSIVTAGQLLAVVSPDTTLVAEVIVSPRDVGLLRPGMAVRLLVDAFNYRDWGALAGRITAIGDDVALADGKPVFRVRCALSTDRLRLANGVVGRLRKGMTLQARFLVARRTLLQLLRDRTTDWLDPDAAPLGPAAASAVSAAVGVAAPTAATTAARPTAPVATAPTGPRVAGPAAWHA